MTKQIVDINRVFHALGDPTRRGVLERLSRGPASVTELAAPYKIALPSFVQHLGVLEESGLVRSAKQGRVRTYELAPRAMTSAEAWLAHQRKFWEKRLDTLDAFLLQLNEREKSHGNRSKK